MRSDAPIPRVLVVATDRLARAALVAVVEEVAVVTDAVGARRDLGAVARSLGVDAVVWDLGVGAVPDGLGGLERPVLVLTESVDVARRAAALGADAVLDRDGDADRLGAALHAVLLGLRVIDARLDAHDAPAADLAPLTHREREVLELLALGHSDRRIGDELGISAHTAKFHVQSLRAKLGASSRTEAVAIAMRAGLIRL